MKNVVLENLKQHTEVAAQTAVLADVIAEAGLEMKRALANGGRVLFCGNGGSAADSQHLAAELSGRYLKERDALDGIALHCDTSALTAIGNDYGFDEIYARQIAAHGRKGDVLVAISTSGNSENIIKAAKKAKQLGLTVIAMTGKSGGKLKAIADILIAVPSDFTPRIQEMHIFIGHCLCEMVDE